MSGRLTAVSGFLHGLFSSQSPGRGSPNTEEREDETMMGSNAASQAGPSTQPGSSPYKLPVLEDASKENDSVMYGVELDTSAAGPSTALGHSARDNGRSIASSGFYGTPRQRVNQPSRAASIKGKERARDTPRRRTLLPVMDELFQPVRTYKCPAADRPLYTLDEKKRTITIHATDADASYWPSRIEKKRNATLMNPTPYSKGSAELVSSPSKKMDWHEPVIKDTKQYLSWQQKCGRGLAEKMDLIEPESWTLTGWPKGYKMFFKHSYQGQYSFFVYIVGSTFLGTRRFKTTKEYTKHLLWLCAFGDDIHARCECRFCNREFERDGKRRTAIMQRVINVPYSGDVPPPKIVRKLLPTIREKLDAKSVPEMQARAPAPYGSALKEGQTDHAASVRDLPAKASPLYVSATLSTNAASAKNGERQEASTVGPPADVEAAFAEMQMDTADPPVEPTSDASRKVRASSSFASAAGEVLSKLFGLASPSIAAAAATALDFATKEEPAQKKARGRPFGSTAAAFEARARAQPVVEIEASHTLHTLASGSAEASTASTATSADGSTLGKRKRSIPVPNYYIKTVEEVEAAEERALADAEETAALNAAINGANGRAIRTTRNLKSMKETTPPPLRVASGPMYTGPFVHRKRHDDLKIHSAPYREHEIVWYRLDNAHVCPDHERLSVTHWPGEVITKTLRIETHHIEIVEIEDLNGDKSHIPQPVNAQYYVYSIELLGVGTSTVIECRVDQLLPWVAYAVPDILKSPDTASLLTKSENPLQSLEQDEDFRHVLTTWVWARQWANAVQSQYSPFGFFHDPETNKKLRRRRRGYNNGSKKSNKKTRAERDAREKEMIREVELIAGNIQFYQGVWFGAEKLWVGDMVRVAGTYEKATTKKQQQEGGGESNNNTAHVQLYAGRTRRDGKGQFVKLDGYTITEDSIGKPAFFQITHIYRVPGAEEGLPGTVSFDGTFYELVKEDEDLWNVEKRPPSLYGDMQGVLDTSDSSSTDQDYVIDPITGAKKLDCSVPSMYRRTLMPPPPVGYRFKPLQKGAGLSEDEAATGVPAFMIAGRYYNSGVLFGDVQSRKLVRACSGKAFRPESTMGPIHWTANRRIMIRGGKKVATRDTSNYFAERERKERDIRKQERMRQERKEAGEGDEEDDSDDGPTVSTSRIGQVTPAGGNSSRRQLQKREGKAAAASSKQTTVTIDDDDDDESDVVMVATSSKRA